MLTQCSSGSPASAALPNNVPLHWPERKGGSFMGQQTNYSSSKRKKSKTFVTSFSIFISKWFFVFLTSESGKSIVECCTKFSSVPSDPPPIPPSPPLVEWGRYIPPPLFPPIAKKSRALPSLPLPSLTCEANNACQDTEEEEEEEVEVDPNWGHQQPGGRRRKKETAVLARQIV